MDFSADDATQPISDDQELAKALAGVVADEPEETAPVDEALPPLPGASTVPVTTPTAADPALPTPTLPGAAPVAPAPEPEAPAAPAVPAVPLPPALSGLDGIKKDALDELRPLVDKVNLPAEDKFDIYLMLIRSTDDSSLIGPAHAASQGIADEKRKAEALLEIIKEIDYLTRKDA